MKSFLHRAAAAAFAAAVCLAMFAPAANAQDKPKILFLTHSAGFKHGSLPVAEATMHELAKKSGAFEVTTLEGYKQEKEKIDLSFINAEYLKPYAAIMFFTTGELPFTDAQKKDLVDFVEGGKAYIGAHSATDTLYKWPGYGKISGAYFKTHGRNDHVLILNVEDKTHPATKMLGDTWPIADEFYQYGVDPADAGRPIPFSRDRLHVLLSIDTNRSDLSGQAGMAKGADAPIAWCQNVGKGRAFYTALGHRDDVWQNLTFQAHLLGGVKWALGLEPGDATPSNKLK